MSTIRLPATLLLAAGAAALPTAVNAAYCSKPDAPYCISSGFSFDDEFAFRNCRSDMERYTSEVTDYLDCLKRDAQDTVGEENESIRKFNCRARGETMCF